MGVSNTINGNVGVFFKNQAWKNRYVFNSIYEIRNKELFNIHIYTQKCMFTDSQDEQSDRIPENILKSC